MNGKTYLALSVRIYADSGAGFIGSDELPGDWETTARPSYRSSLEQPSPDLRALHLIAIHYKFSNHPPSMGRPWTFLRRDPPAEDLTPLQRGLMRAVSLNYFEIGTVETESIDRMWNIGLVRVEIDGSIVPTKMGEGIIDGTIRTRDGTPPFLAGLVR